MFRENRDNHFVDLYYKIKRYEEITDKMEVEIATYLTKISEGELSKIGSARIKAMLRIVDFIENVADVCYNISKTLYRKKMEKIWFTQEMRDNINQIFGLMDKAFFEMIENLGQDYNLADSEKARDIEGQINELKESLKAEHLENVEQGSYKYEAGVIYNDIFSQCERMGDFVYYVSETIEEFKQLHASAKQK